MAAIRFFLKKIFHRAPQFQMVGTLPWLSACLGCSGSSEVGVQKAAHPSRLQLLLDSPGGRKGGPKENLGQRGAQFQLPSRATFFAEGSTGCLGSREEGSRWPVVGQDQLPQPRRAWLQRARQGGGAKQPRAGGRGKGRVLGQSVHPRGPNCIAQALSLNVSLYFTRDISH